MNQINYRQTFNPAFIYSLRYSKKDEYSLERLWNLANHLVTTCKYYKTESLNLNFIFFGADSKESQWRYLYKVLPYLLFYSIEVIQAVLDQEIGKNRFEILIETFKERAVKFENIISSNNN